MVTGSSGADHTMQKSQVERVFSLFPTDERAGQREID